MTVIMLIYMVIALTSTLAYISYCIPKMQSNVFILISSWVFFALCYLTATSLGQTEQLMAMFPVIHQIDYYSLVVDGMLCYLLFAGCLHVDISSFFENMKVILTLAIATTMFSFLLTAATIYAVFQWLGIDYPLVSCFLYAAVIAPTDPVAVLALLKSLDLSKMLYAKIASESLLNDGVGVVLFVSVLKFRHLTTLDGKMFLDMVLYFLWEGAGGLMVGCLLAVIFLRYSMQSGRSEDVGFASNKDVFLLLALLNTGYLVSQALHVSPPLVAVGSGLYTSYALQSLTDQQRSVLYVFWDTIDEILNYILFFIVGFQSLFVDLSSLHARAMVWAVMLNFLVRIVSVSLPLLSIRVGYKQNTTLYKVLVIGGLKGGLSLALALSIPRDFPGSELIFDMAYAVVAFTVIVQGLSIERYLKVIQSRKVHDEIVI